MSLALFVERESEFQKVSPELVEIMYTSTIKPALEYDLGREI
jgi:hypothetical protein